MAEEIGANRLEGHQGEVLKAQSESPIGQIPLPVGEPMITHEQTHMTKQPNPANSK